MKYNLVVITIIATITIILLQPIIKYVILTTSDIDISETPLVNGEYNNE